MKTTMQITGDRNIPRLWLTVALLLISALLLSGQASRTVASGSMDAIAAGSAWTDLVNGSDVIVRAHVLTTITNWEGDEIASVHLVETHYTLLGEPPARFVVHTRGGILPNGVGMAVSNMPTLATNEEVLLFLARNPDDSYRIISDEGKLTVENGHASSVNLALEVLAEGPVFGEFLSVNDWVSPKGQQLLQEITSVRVYNHPDNCRIMDWDITWLAAYGGVFLGDTKEAGTISVRMIESAHARNGGTFRNSFGGVNEEECWGKKAEWVDYYGPIASGIGGIAIFDHPENLRYPTTWHVRNYGLFTANQWGLHDFTDDWSQRGDYALKQGDALNFLFRLYIHDGDTFHADVAGKYLDFIYPPKVKAVQ